MCAFAVMPKGGACDINGISTKLSGLRQQLRNIWALLVYLNIGSDISDGACNPCTCFSTASGMIHSHTCIASRGSSYLPHFHANVSAWARRFMLYRLGFSSLPHAAWQNIRYSVQFFFLFNSISFHLSVAFASHLLGYQMQWGITSKVRGVFVIAMPLWLPLAACIMHQALESLQQRPPCVQEVVASNFFKELRFTFFQYRTMYCLFAFFTVMMVRPQGSLISSFACSMLVYVSLLCGCQSPDLLDMSPDVPCRW